MKKHRVRHSKDDALTHEGVQQLLSGCRDRLDRLLILLPVHTGMRIGEIQHLRTSWLDWDKGLIVIPSRQQCTSCFECRTTRGNMWSPKSVAGVRNLIITDELRPTLESFFSKPGASVNRSRQALSQRFERIRVRSRLEHHCYPHALRAVFATRLAEANISAPALAYLMGWQSITQSEAYCQTNMKRAHDEQRNIASN